MSELNLSHKRAKVLWSEMELFELIIPLHFYRLTMYARRKYWNGAGSDNTPAFMRYIFTKLLRMIPCTIWIHDISCEQKEWDSWIIDEDFHKNGTKEIEARTETWLRMNYEKQKLAVAVFAINCFNKEWKGKV